MTPPLALVVRLHVKPAARDAFLYAIRENAADSIREPGCLYFDVVRHDGDPDRFTLYELYRDEAAIEFHRSTPHYRRWREAAASCLEPEDGQVNQLGGVVFPRADGSSERAVILRAGELPSVDRGQGVRTTYLAGRHVGSSRFMNGVTEFDPRASLQTHCHNCEESVVVLRGPGMVRLRRRDGGARPWGCHMGARGGMAPVPKREQRRLAHPLDVRMRRSDAYVRGFGRDDLDSTALAVSAHRIVLIHGDGIGPELVDAATEILDVLQSGNPGLRLEVQRADAGARNYLETGVNRSDEGLEAGRGADAILTGSGGPSERTSARRHRRRLARRRARVRPMSMRTCAPSSYGLESTVHWRRAERESIT